MKRLIALLLLVAMFAPATYAHETERKGEKKKKEVQYNENGEIIKTGYNYGPLPAVAFDADKGFQLGALLNIYDFGDGSTYPNTRQQWYFEASFFTKGSQLFVVSYDNKFLIPGVRWSSTFTLTNEKAMDFYGFNGYMSYFDHEKVAAMKEVRIIGHIVSESMGLALITRDGVEMELKAQGWNNE